MLAKSAICFFVIALAVRAEAAVTLPSFFGDHMVLQRETAVPIWGNADPDSVVTVSFSGQAVETKADANGSWRVELKALSASRESQLLTVKAGDSTVTVNDVLVGDVWLGSGQSNMAGRVASYAKSDEMLAALAARASFPKMRLMQSGPTPVWTAATSENVSAFSALHFAFGERLQRELDVPVGLIVGAVGGTPSGYWIPPETFAASEECKASIAEFAKTYDDDAARKQYATQLAGWQKLVDKAKAAGKQPPGRKPSPPTGPGESIRGGKIGNLYERYIQPIAGYRIRGVLWDQGEARSGVNGVDQYLMMSELIRGWRAVWGQGEFPFLFVQKPSGGGCAFSSENPITRNGDRFVDALPAIDRIGNGEQRVLYVRLMRNNSNAWMVPASDLGSGIHPTNKWGYGNRAAEVALSQVYKTGVQAYGPLYRSHSVNGPSVTVEFDHVGKGLTIAHSDKLQGFALAGEDGRWSWADATIEGDTVVLSAKDVLKPTRVRFAYTQNRAFANLFNKDGLPAISFSTGE